MISALRFDYILIIEWLSDEERTGENLYRWFSGPAKRAELVKFQHCESARDVLNCLRNAAQNISVDGIPMVHIEAHGSEPSGGGRGGLSDRESGGEILYWEDLWEVLRTLNVATGYNLVAVIAACYGEIVRWGVEDCLAAGLSGEDYSRVKPLPFMISVGFEEKVGVGVLRDGIREFYRSLVTDFAIDRAVESANREIGSRGKLVWIWVGSVALGALNELETGEFPNLADLIKRDEGREPSPEELVRIEGILKAHSKEVHTKMMERMLGYDTHPQNRIRFPWTRTF